MGGRAGLDCVEPADNADLQEYDEYDDVSPRYVAGRGAGTAALEGPATHQVDADRGGEGAEQPGCCECPGRFLDAEQE
ncbi:MAG: hypothetical protein M0Z42_15395 [Actinomycetota bacterium]|nr:hypothetical protein [Actinomycetota bacterium]